jgi:hypothetical protein
MTVTGRGLPHHRRPDLTQSGNQSSYKAVIEANESGRPRRGETRAFSPRITGDSTVRGGHLKGALCTPHVPV